MIDSTAARTSTHRPTGTDPETTTGRVLIVEDDEATAFALRDGFEFEGYEVLVATNGRTAVRMANEERPDVILLDVMLPEMSGIDVCKQIRGASNNVPIIMLTARGQEVDKVLGLKIGADDYVTKPFSFMELQARVEAVLRRSTPKSEPAALVEFGDVRLDFKMLEASKGECRLDFSPLEFKLMKFFIDNRQQVVTRDQMLRSVWNSNSSMFTRTVDMHVAKLRKKIEDSPNHPRYIITIYGVGYKFLG
ncbi:MAG: response regulator transcription factor [Blastocatellia bacterium]|nr:response regulator transcription factor [Blastocatellia bacterium]MBK6425288.1 response regulator transcription factor [Blastocatellia bacterium]